MSSSAPSDWAHPGAAHPVPAIVGLGVVGRTVVDVLLATGVPSIRAVESRSTRHVRPDRRVEQVSADLAYASSVVILCGPSPQFPTARTVLERGGSCVTTSDDASDVRQLLNLSMLAEEHGVAVVVGATMMPGLSGLLARTLADAMLVADEIHSFAHGTGGPVCARQHHQALGGAAVAWHDGAWMERPAGSGRELCWFPDPVGPRDCYRIETPEPELMVRAFPSATRVSARLSATRRDRLTSRLPMMSPPHPDGGIGGLRVEVRGSDASGRVTTVLGASGRPGVIAGTVAAAFAGALLDGSISATGLVVPGSAELPNRDLLDRVRDAGVTISEFVGPSM